MWLAFVRLRYANRTYELIVPTALEDLCENEITNRGITGKSNEEWEQLIERATEFVKTIPVEFYIDE